MLKLNASFSKKVPAELDYSSKSYMASVEVELPTNLSPEELKSEIHKTYAHLEAAVEEQISGKVTQFPQRQRSQRPRRQRASEGKASSKQINYLLDLSKARSMTLMQLTAEVMERFGVESVYELDRKSCSLMIDQLQQKAA